jgi:hypothetical protein
VFHVADPDVLRFMIPRVAICGGDPVLITCGAWEDIALCRMLSVIVVHITDTTPGPQYGRHAVADLILTRGNSFGVANPPLSTAMQSVVNRRVVQTEFLASTTTTTGTIITGARSAVTAALPGALRILLLRLY